MTATQQVATQSRLGKRPIAVPAGVQVTINGGQISVKGPRGEITRELRSDVSIKKTDDGLVIGIVGNAPRANRFQGLTRALVANMVQGVHEGFKKSMDLRGVGYRAELSGDKLTMTLGLSHQVIETIPKTVTAKIEIIDEVGMKYPRVHLESHVKEAVGQVAARIRAARPAEPYKGKGVRYTGERIREKAGKAGKAGA
jgi:large subunit ribosomal protein L6